MQYDVEIIYPMFAGDCLEESIFQNDAKVVIIKEEKNPIPLEIPEDFERKCKVITTPLPIWEAIANYYDHSYSPYIALATSHDHWVVEKIRTQKRILRQEQAPLCFCAYIDELIEPYRHTLSTVKFPVKLDRYGLENCPLGSWFLDHTKIRELPRPKDFTDLLQYEIGVGLELCQEVKRVPVVALPLMVHYNFHDETQLSLDQKMSYSHLIETQLSLDQKQVLHKYCQNMLLPNLRYIDVPITTFGFPTPQEQQEENLYRRIVRLNQQ